MKICRFGTNATIHKASNLLGRRFILLITFPFWFPLPFKAVGSIQFWRFKSKIRENVNPVELQQWATNLLSQYPKGPSAYYDTNLPPGLPTGISNLKGYRQVTLLTSNTVILFMARANPGYMIVGNASYNTTNYGCEMWQPGIYFCKPRE